MSKNYEIFFKIASYMALIKKEVKLSVFKIKI